MLLFFVEIGVVLKQHLNAAAADNSTLNNNFMVAVSLMNPSEPSRDPIVLSQNTDIDLLK